MHRDAPASAWRHGGLVMVWLLFGIVLAACDTEVVPSRPPPTVVITSTPGPPTAVPPTPTPEPTATPTPIVLVVCQTIEPDSLYLYSSGASARAGIYQALFDGPIDSVGYAYQPVILEVLPSLENGGVTLREVEVRPGDRVVDAATHAVVPLAEGVQLAQAGGHRVTYSGAEPARTVQLEAVFRLRRDVRWSDGVSVDADDSVFSFEVASSPDTPISKFVVDRTARYEAVEPLATRWTGMPGWVDAEFFLRFWPPLPRHVYGRLSPAELAVNAAANEKPLGWGPFMMGEWARGSHMTLRRNPEYFRASEGLPRVDQVTFRFGLSAEAILAEMRAGRCDIGGQAAGFAEQIPALLAAQSEGWLAPQFVSTTSFEHLDFGIQPAEDFSRVAGTDVFEDVRVRHALAYCLDRQAIVDQLLYGLSEVPAVYVPSTHPLYAGDRLTYYPFDPARGQALLEEAGWSDTNGDGIRERGRRKLSLEYASGPEGNAFREMLLSLVQSQLLSHCGVELRPVYNSLDDLYAPWPSGVLFGRKFDLGQFPWRTGIQPPCELYMSEAIPSNENPGGSNNTGYSSLAFDLACQAARGALDETTRRVMHTEAQAIFTRDLPSLPLFWRVTAGVALPRVNGYVVDSTASSDLWNIENFSLAP